MERKTRQVVSDTEYYSVDEAVKVSSFPSYLSLFFASPSHPVHVAYLLSQERFRIHERNVNDYMRGQWNVEKKLETQLRKKQIKEKDVDSIKKKANTIQGTISPKLLSYSFAYHLADEIVSKHLDSSLRTVVRRSAFQNGYDQVTHLF